MKLYNRLLTEGIFLFWEDDKKNDYYVIDFYVKLQDKNIKIKEERVEGNIRCYSIDKIGGGDYYIELTSYKNDKEIEKDNKTVKLASMSAQINELLELNRDIKNCSKGTAISIDHIKYLSDKYFEIKFGIK